MFEGAGFEVVEVRGKSIVPVRDNKMLFAKDGAIERLVALEEELGRDPAAAVRAGHLQVVAKKVSSAD